MQSLFVNIIFIYTVHIVIYKVENGRQNVEFRTHQIICLQNDNSKSTIRLLDPHRCNNRRQLEAAFVVEHSSHNGTLVTSQ